MVGLCGEAHGCVKTFWVIDTPGWVGRRILLRKRFGLAALTAAFPGPHLRWPADVPDWGSGAAVLAMTPAQVRTLEPCSAKTNPDLARCERASLDKFYFIERLYALVLRALKAQGFFLS